MLMRRESHAVVQLDGLEGLEVQVEPLQMKDHRVG
jgi:hypothetical protein